MIHDVGVYFSVDFSEKICGIYVEVARSKTYDTEVWAYFSADLSEKTYDSPKSKSTVLINIDMLKGCTEICLSASAIHINGSKNSGIKSASRVFGQIG